jgi:prolyl-tRNA editing enzyme YbaK/EbsC (Cys-tRNA(Pro) deacylase)
MSQNIPPESLLVQSWLISHGFQPEIRYQDEPTHTSQAAADALGCNLGQIAKSLIFYEVATSNPVLIIASGANRVDKLKVGEYLGQKIKTASPDFVLEVTGFAVGGVPPVAHKTPLKTLIDEDLMQYDIIYAAAGHPHTLFAIPPQTLIQITGATIVAVKGP